MCEAVAIVKDGQLVSEQSIEQIRRMRFRQVQVTFVRDAPDELKRIANVELQSVNGRRYVLAVDGDINPLIDALARCEIEDLTIVPPSLDDVFMTFYESAGSTNMLNHRQVIAATAEVS